MRKIMITVALLLVAACAQNNQGSLPSPANTVYALKNTLASAEIVAVQYNSLARCGRPTSPPLCSDAGVISIVRQSNDDARIALDAAEKTVRDPNVSKSAADAAVVSAQNAVGAFQAITSKLKVK